MYSVPTQFKPMLFKDQLCGWRVICSSQISLTQLDEDLNTTKNDLFHAKRNQASRLLWDSNCNIFLCL